MKNFLIGFLVVIILLIGGTYLAGYGYLFKAFNATYLRGDVSATIDDARFFDTHLIEASDDTWQWPLHPDYFQKDLSDELEQVLLETKTVAFLVARNDSIVQEHYWDGYSAISKSNSFSMAKSIVTMLAQIAIQKGIFEGWDQKVNDILPNVGGPHAAELELWNLSTMTAGQYWDEDYKNPFKITAKAYYGPDVWKAIEELPIDIEPGTEWEYQSGSTQLLGMCLIQATGKSLADLASEWLWKPLGAEQDALWHTDDKGTEMAYCCFNSNARDFARFSKLMLHYGNWNGTQIIDSSFVSMATKPSLVPFYGYSFWLDDSHGTEVYYQRGILGQYIISIPEYHLSIVRLGHMRWPADTDEHPRDFHIIMDEVLKEFANP